MKSLHSDSLLQDFEALLHGVRKHCGKASVIALAFFAAGALYVIRSPNLYTAQAILQVEQAERRVTNIQDISQEDFRSIETLKTLETRFTTDAILLRVIHANHLESNPYFAQEDPANEDKLIKRLRGVVKVKLQRSTRLINVSVEAQSPELARTLAASLIEELMEQDAELRAGISQTTNSFLVRQAGELQAKLQKAERELQSYRENNHAVSLEDKQNIVVDTLKELNRQLAEATNQRRRLESDYAQYQLLVAGKSDELLNIPTIAGSANVQQLRKALFDQEAVVAGVAQRYRSEHPQYIQAQSQLQQMRAELDSALRKSGAGMKNAAEAAATAESGIRRALEEQQQAAMELARLAIPYNQLEREIASDRALYESVLARLKETDVTASLNSENLRLVQPARAEERPTRPKIPLILAASLVVGLGAGLGTALLLESLDASFKTVGEVEHGLGVISSGAIPVGGGRRKPAGRLLAWKEADSPAAEAFRSLRATLSLGGHDGEHPAIVFTSAVPGEGKSFCSLNYATVLAQQNLRTLLIDAELRASTISAELLGQQRVEGLGDYLDGKCCLAAAIHPTPVPNLWLLPSGSLVDRPAELMASEAALNLLTTAEAAGFHRIVIDAGPVNSISDALPLIRRIRQVCLVVKAGGAPANTIDHAYQTLVRLSGAENVRVVVNHLPVRSGRSCYYHHMTGKYGDRPVYGRSIGVPAKA